MPRRKTYKRRNASRLRYWRDNRYVRIGGVIMIIIVAASFYIYQRVWVRNLITDVEELQERNEHARQLTTVLKSGWMSATSIASIEAAISDRKLALEPTKPTQNMGLRSPREWDGGRYAGLMRALDKLVDHMPLIRSNEADAHELFQEE